MRVIGCDRDAVAPPRTWCTRIRYRTSGCSGPVWPSSSSPVAPWNPSGRSGRKQRRRVSLTGRSTSWSTWSADTTCRSEGLATPPPELRHSARQLPGVSVVSAFAADGILCTSNCQTRGLGIYVICVQFEWAKVDPRIKDFFLSFNILVG